MKPNNHTFTITCLFLCFVFVLSAQAHQIRSVITRWATEDVGKQALIHAWRERTREYGTEADPTVR